MKSVTGDSTKATNAKSRTGERLTIDHIVRKTECFSDHTDLILEEQFYRLYKFELHILGKTANVVMRLNTVAFQNIGIDGALRKEGDAFQFGGFLIKYLDKLTADDLALLFRFADTVKQIKESVGGIYID